MTSTPPSGGRDPAEPEAIDYPIPRDAPFGPPSLLARLRDDGQVPRVRTPDGSCPWLFTRYDDVRTVLGDPRTSVHPSTPGMPTTSPALRARNAARPTFLTLDDPEHARLRRAVAAEFTPRRVEAMRPLVQEVVEDRLDAVADARDEAGVDLVSSFALPVTSMVICRLLGVPYADHGMFQRCAGAITNLSSTPTEVAAASEELTAYLADLLARRRAAPTDDLIGRLAGNHVGPGDVSEDEATATLLLLLMAGHETTAHSIALGVLLLLTEPDALVHCRDGDDRDVTAWVEELLRLTSVVHLGPSRAALADLEIGGVVVRAGDGILPVTAAANRDPRIFADPDIFAPGRVGSEPSHLAFGFGVHRCLGQNLARIELGVGVRSLLRRFPGLRLTQSVDALRFRDEMIVYGPRELPVTW